jgi:hypothetical protein
MALIKTTVKDMRRLEAHIIRDIYTQYIAPTNSGLSYKSFKQSIIARLRAQPKTQESITEAEHTLDKHNADQGIQRCQYVIMDKNRIRQCHNKISDDSPDMCHIHATQHNSLAPLLPP